jgi:hypothetical protein
VARFLVGLPMTEDDNGQKRSAALTAAGTSLRAAKVFAGRQLARAPSNWPSGFGGLWLRIGECAHR